MIRSFKYLVVSAALLSLGSCASHYDVTAVTRSRVLIDNRYDNRPDADAAAFMAPYKHKVDSMMTFVVGRVAEDMSAYRPESNLSNLLSDILVWAGTKYNQHPDFAVYNMGGMRASLNKGDVTFGDVLDVSPFENKLCFITLKGTDIKQLFREIATLRGEGVSHGVKLVVSQKGELLSDSLNGKAINPDGIYHVATLDYLAQGNGGMLAFKKKIDEVSPQPKDKNIMDLIVEYFQEQLKAGVTVDRKVEGRIIIKK
jgi:2',3'-cyclic-nucleotide 2'-phosphodiesterase (5'-nucleotidase family)